MVSLLRCQGLAIGYSGLTIGADINLQLVAGEVMALLGPNGCGKTTLFRTLLGLIPAKQGAVLIDDHPLVDLSRRDIARRIAYVPQAQQGSFSYTVMDIVVMGRAAWRPVFSGPAEADKKIARQALAQLNIESLAEREYQRLSGGQRQLVLIARALAQQAAVIVMDEPTASLDFGNQSLVIDKVRALADSGLAILLSTHEPDHAFACADQVALMRNGRICAQGNPADVLTDQALSGIYQVPVQVEVLPDGRRVCLPKIGRL
ncbi:MAG: ABC transporter ATP-binding protein [Burkholderiaceae bacterium]